MLAANAQLRTDDGIIPHPHLGHTGTVIRSLGGTVEVLWPGGDLTTELSSQLYPLQRSNLS